MAPSEADSRMLLVISPALDKIIKSASWRKHSRLAHQCKSIITRFSSPSSPISPSPTTPPLSPSSRETQIPGPTQLSLTDSHAVLRLIIDAASSGVLNIAEPAVDCIQKLIAYGCIRGEADASGSTAANLLFRLIESVCKCHNLDDDGLELMVLKALLSAVTSTYLRIHGDCLLQIVRTCYDVYLSSRSIVNQTTAKASLIQMLAIVFRRMEADSSTAPVQPIVVAELMEPAGNSGGDASFVQGFITKIMQDIDVVLNPALPLGMGSHESTAVEMTNPADLLDSTDKDMLDAKYWEISMYKTALEGRKGELEDGDGEDRADDLEVQIENKLRRDAFLVFRALCKLSMKMPPKEALSDPRLMRGKIVASEDFAGECRSCL